MSKIVCPKCGNLADSNEMFCQFCGTKLTGIPQEQPSAGPAQWPQQQPQYQQTPQQPRPQMPQQPRPQAQQQPQYRQREMPPKSSGWVFFLRIFAWVFSALILAAGIVGAIFLSKKDYVIWLVIACPAGALLLSVAFISCAMVRLHIADETHLIRKQLYGNRK